MRRLLAGLLSVRLWAVLILLAGVVLTVIGIDTLAGRGWSFLAAGMMLTLSGIVLLRGLSRAG